MRFDIFLDKAGKFLGITILSLVVFYIGAESGYQIKYRLEVWKNANTFELFSENLINLFKNDTFGGETPEGTFNLFIDALKEEDIDLAVRYFVLDPDRRMSYWGNFAKLKAEGKLAGYTNGWPEWSGWKQVEETDNSLTIEYYWTLDVEETISLPNGAGGFIEQVLMPGKYRRTIDFVKSYNGIWKIENL